MAYLYHYTSCEGLFGMLREYDKDANPNLTMWATNVLFMNDASEYQFGKNICKDLVMHYEADEQIDNGFAYVYNTLDTIVAQNDMQTPYIISLSKREENAAIWSMYSNNGRGIAIAFDSERLDGYINKSNTFLEECWYCTTADDLLSNKKIKQYIAELYKSCFATPHSGSLPPNMDPKSFYDIVYAVKFQLEVSTKIKHASFDYESEVRLTRLGTDKPQFRVKGGVIVPYKEVLIPIEAISSIIIGPTADREYVQKSLKIFLKTKGLDELAENIKQSLVPYRG